MKIKQVETMILKTEMKEKQDHTNYVSISIAIIEDGTTFNVNTTNLDLINLEPFSKHLANFVLQDSKYGLRLALENID